MIRLIRRRAGALVVLSIALVVAGGGGAAAYWSGQAQLDGQARGATVGVQQQLLPTGASSPLETVFTSLSTAAAGQIVLTNLGSREAEYELAVLAASPTIPGLPAAISVSAAPIAADGVCDTDTVLTEPMTGALSATTAFVVPGQLAAGASVILCVQTSMSERDAAVFAGQSNGIAFSAALTYAAGEAWRAEADSVVVTQQVGSGDRFVPGDGQYQMPNGDGRCIAPTGHDGSTVLARQHKCTHTDAAAWVFEDAGDGAYVITPAGGAGSYWHAMPPEAEAEGENEPLRLATHNNIADAQRWSITGSSADGYRLESIAYPTYCVAMGTSINGSGNSWHRVTLAKCDPGAPEQSFEFQLEVP